jgi:putative peptidoglycan lipid II flippase
MSRGVVQVSAFIDQLIATWLPTGAVTALANAQVLYTLPVSLFGISVAAAELPALAGEAGRANADPAVLGRRLDAGLRQIAFFVVPSAVAFAALGDVIVAALLQTGRFSAADARLVWGILAGSALGLLASTLGRLYASGHYALRDTRTPFRFALLRVTLATATGYMLAVHVPGWIGAPRLWGAAGLTVASGLAGWVELVGLRRAFNRRVGPTGLPPGYVARLLGSATLAAAVAWGGRLALPALHPVVLAGLVLPAYGAVFLALCRVLGVPEARVPRFGRVAL